MLDKDFTRESISDRLLHMDCHERFGQLCERLGLAAGIAEVHWDALAARYSEPHRHYHNLAHVGSMLETMDRVKADGPALELAIWFHDVIYDPKSGDNERRSADFFQSGLGELLDDELSEQVVRLIRATDYASRRNGRSDEDLIRDIDLSILGSTAGGYKDYAEAIRSEYAHVRDKEFSKGRRAVLEGLLSEQIFHTEPLAGLESKARTNIQAEIDGLAVL